MFKDLFQFLNTEERNQEILDLAKDINQLAFIEDLKQKLDEQKLSLEKIDLKTLISFILLEKGLNYGNLPKGLLK